LGNRRQKGSLAVALALALVASCRTTGGRGAVLAEGPASYYGKGLDGRPTASGERFDKSALTAAHRSLPFGSCVRVEELKSGRSVEVRINDRGPFTGGRIIDLSEAAARVLGILEVGVARVRLYRC
jgi:rare lipoprotein A